MRPPPSQDGYKWVALSNTTLGVLMATINASSLLIAMPEIFRGIKLDPLAPGNFTYLLWMLMGYLLVMAVLVVTLGRIGDMVGRVRIYNLGFLVFTLGSIGLSLTWSAGSAGALEIIVLRMVQAVGGAMLTANGVAIITDAFPADQRGMALGINLIAGLTGSFVGLVLGGVLAALDWRWVFLINVPVGVFGTAWAYWKLRELSERQAARIDWLGNMTFAAGLIMLLVGLTYGIKPYRDATMGWRDPFVIAMVAGGLALLVAFVFVELRVREPMIDLRLFRIRAFAAGNVATILAAVSQGGLQFILIVWLQGIWLPLHGYNFVDTPLWAGIYMLPLTTGFMLAGPLAGWMSDRHGARGYTTGGMLAAAASFVLLVALPVDFTYWIFALLLFTNGFAFGFFASPNTAAIMNSVPARVRGAASGMRATFQNTGTPLSLGVFFTLMVIGLSASVPQALKVGLTQEHVPTADVTRLAGLPPTSYLFAAFLGYDPLKTLLGPHVLAQLPSTAAHQLLSKTYFPSLISASFKRGLVDAFAFAAAVCVAAAAVSWLRGRRFVHEEAPRAPTEQPDACEACLRAAAACPPTCGAATQPRVSDNCGRRREPRRR